MCEVDAATKKKLRGGLVERGSLGALAFPLAALSAPNSPQYDGVLMRPLAGDKIKTYLVLAVLSLATVLPARGSALGLFQFGS